MSSADRMTSRDAAVLYTPPQRSIFSDRLSVGVVSKLTIDPETQGFRLEYHSSYLKHSPFWASLDLLENRLGNAEGDHDVVVKVLERAAEMIRFQWQNESTPPLIVEFDTLGDYPVLRFVGDGLDTPGQPGHRFENIVDSADGFRYPLTYRHVIGQVPTPGRDGLFWRANVWTATNFTSDVAHDDFTIEWPDGTAVSGDLLPSQRRVNLFIPLDEESSTMANKYDEGEKPSGESRRVANLDWGLAVGGVVILAICLIAFWWRG
jgi:hypothetical protein